MQKDNLAFFDDKSSIYSQAILFLKRWDAFEKKSLDKQVQVMDYWKA